MTVCLEIDDLLIEADVSTYEDSIGDHNVIGGIKTFTVIEIDSITVFKNGDDITNTLSLQDLANFEDLAKEEASYRLD